MTEIVHERHERPDVKSRRVAGLSLGFVGFAILLGGGLAIYYRAITSGEKLAQGLQDFPAPRLQPNPGQDWVTFHKAQREDLEGYRWVDRSKGLIHVPIERAMAIVAARGVHAYDPVDGTPPFPATAGSAPLDGAPRATAQPMAAPYGNVR